ncbi:MAG: CBS domain-containing protein [Actinomycetota bacterium]|nr:CBS domain-containing protein [Actinomycetota bacterium]
MSPRAAWRLERLGFGPIYDYVAGKVDWLAAGLRTVRADTNERRAIDAVDDAPPTCGPDTPLGELPEGDSVIVVNAERVVLGRVPASRPDGPEQTAEQVMQPGPTTVRANEPLDPLLARMADRSVVEMLVTTPEGRLLGTVRRTAGEHSQATDRGLSRPVR